MERLINIFSENKPQYLLFISLSVSMLILTGILYGLDKSSYQRFLGRMNPLLIFIITMLLGILLMSFLLSATTCKINQKAALSRIIFIMGIPLILIAGIVWVDTRGVFPKDLNVEFPHSLLFYPSIAYIVEIIFHVLPFTLCFFIVTTIFKQLDHAKALLIIIPLVALIEPIFQIINFGRNYPFWAVAYVGANILVINLSQLWLFVKYDFISMFALRLVYYLLWHIIWGELRLRWLF
jgi:hypothetical protein